MKILFFTTSLLFFITIFNSSTIISDNTLSKNHDMLEMAVKHELPHFQSTVEQKLIKKYKIKSAAYIIESKSENKIDSATYLIYDSEGRIISRTTSECTTVGCLPYTIRQQFIYSGNKIKRMDDYTFKYKHKNVLDYWTIKDTSVLSKFDWEDYSYKNDTIIVESGSQVWKFCTDPNGHIIYKRNKMKATKQFIEIKYKYLRSRVDCQLRNSSIDSVVKTSYKIENNNTVQNNGIHEKNKIYTAEYKFDSKGLLSKILHFINGKLTSETTINYSYYNN